MDFTSEPQNLVQGYYAVHCLLCFALFNLDYFIDHGNEHKLTAAALVH